MLKQHSFRPTFEVLKRRLVPTTITFLGRNTTGMWNAGTQRVSFFTVEFTGTFSYANANDAWNQALKLRWQKGNFSLDTTDRVSERNNLRTITCSLAGGT